MMKQNHKRSDDEIKSCKNATTKIIQARCEEIKVESSVKKAINQSHSKLKNRQQIRPTNFPSRTAFSTSTDSTSKGKCQGFHVENIVERVLNRHGYNTGYRNKPYPYMFFLRQCNNRDIKNLQILWKYRSSRN